MKEFKDLKEDDVVYKIKGCKENENLLKALVKEIDVEVEIVSYLSAHEIIIVLDTKEEVLVGLTFLM